jgi:hypothetical protein
MLSCRRVTRTISDELDNKTSLLGRLGMTIHLLGCPPCRRFLGAARWLHRELAGAPAEGVLSGAARERIGRAVEEAAGQ